MPFGPTELRSVRVGVTNTGLGVFAARSFRPGQAVGLIEGNVHEDPNHSSDYCIELTDDTSLEPHAPFRYLNHSCRPNCELINVILYDEHNCPTDDSEMTIEAIHPIRSGEQLTIDYAWSAETAIPCACGSDVCRGWIVAADEAHELPAPQPVRDPVVG